jgi:hypothetical protein
MRSSNMQHNWVNARMPLLNVVTWLIKQIKGQTIKNIFKNEIHSVPVIGTVRLTGTQLQSSITGLLVIRTNWQKSVPLTRTVFMYMQMSLVHANGFYIVLIVLVIQTGVLLMRTEENPCYRDKKSILSR